MDIHKPHDSLFKEAFSDRNIDNVKDLIKNTLPVEIINEIDYSSIDVSKDSFIDEELKDSYSDLLISAKFGHKNVNIYLLYEHKSYLNKQTIFQMLKYMIKIWERDLAEKHKYFTPIIPVIFYHGEADWKYDTNFASYFDIKNLNNFLVKHLPNFDCELYNLPKISDDNIVGNYYFQTVIRVMKYVFHNLKDNLFYVLSLINELDERSFRIVLTYLLATSDITNIDRNSISETTKLIGKGDDVMTIYEELIKEGEKKGKQEGRQEGEKIGIEKGEKIAKMKTAKKMKNKNLPIELIIDVTGLSKEEIDSL